MTSFYLTKLYPQSNFDRLYLRQYRSYEQTSKHRSASFWPEKGFGPHQDVIDIFSIIHKVLQVKCTVGGNFNWKKFRSRVGVKCWNWLLVRHDREWIFYSSEQSKDLHFDLWGHSHKTRSRVSLQAWSRDWMHDGLNAGDVCNHLWRFRWRVSVITSFLLPRQWRIAWIKFQGPFQACYKVKLPNTEHRTFESANKPKIVSGPQGLRPSWYFPFVWAWGPLKGIFYRSFILVG
jgi:hypothetical protein